MLLNLKKYSNYVEYRKKNCAYNFCCFYMVLDLSVLGDINLV